MSYFRVYVDLTGGGSPTTEITQWVKEVGVITGLRDPLRTIADVGECEITLNNADKRFSPAYSSGAYYGQLLPGRAVKVDVVEGAGTYTIFTGSTQSWMPQATTNQQREAVLRCQDYFGALQNYYISIPLQRGLTGDALAKMVLAAALRGNLASTVARFNTTANVADGDTITVNGTVYRFKTSMAQINDIRIATGAKAVEDTIDALIAAINGDQGDSTLYYTGTTRPAGIVASNTSTYYRTVLQDQPVRLYRLSDTTTTASDLGLNGRNGTLAGGYTQSVTGACANDPDAATTLNGTTGYVSLPTMNFASRSFTLEAWVKVDSSPNAVNTAISLYSGAGAGEYLAFGVYNTGFVYVDLGGGNTLFSAAAITLNTWTHLALVYDAVADTMTIYVNGASSNFNTIGPFTGSNPVVNIGALNSSSQWFDGTIDEVALYLHPVPAARIALHYAARDVYRGVTLTANARGTWANTLAVSESSSAISLSSGTLSGGTNGSATLDFETGQSTLDIAGDTWRADTTNALSALEQITQSEFGLMWQGGDGTLYWRGRDWLQSRGVSSSLTVNGVAQDADATVDAEQTFNRVVVSYTARTQKLVGVIARSPEDIKVAPAAPGIVLLPDRSNPAVLTPPLKSYGVVRKKIPYVDLDSGKISAAESVVLPLVAATDFNVTDQYGGDYNKYPAAWGVGAAINGPDIEIILTNKAVGQLIFTDVQVRGEALIAYDQQQFIVDDETSQTAYGRRALAYDIPLAVSNADAFAEALATWLLTKYATAQTRVTRIALRNIVKIGTDVLWNFGTGDIITYADAQIGGGGNRFMIIGAEYRLMAGATAETEITWYVRRADTEQVWLVDGTSQLDGPAVLGI